MSRWKSSQTLPCKTEPKNVKPRLTPGLWSSHASRGSRARHSLRRFCRVCRRHLPGLSRGFVFYWILVKLQYFQISRLASPRLRISRCFQVGGEK